MRLSLWGMVNLVHQNTWTSSIPPGSNLYAPQQTVAFFCELLDCWGGGCVFFTATQLFSTILLSSLCSLPTFTVKHTPVCYSCFYLLWLGEMFRWYQSFRIIFTGKFPSWKSTVYDCPSSFFINASYSFQPNFSRIHMYVFSTWWIPTILKIRF